MTKDKAYALAETIREYWRGLGCEPPRVWVVSETVVNPANPGPMARVTLSSRITTDSYTVRSDMRAGLPRRLTRPQARALAADVRARFPYRASPEPRPELETA